MTISEKISTISNDYTNVEISFYQDTGVSLFSNEKESLLPNLKDFYVSVIIPYYNGENKITYLLNALKYQTFTNYEIIIVNDDSPQDNIKNILEKEFWGISITYVKHNKNISKGSAHAVNTGIFLAKYENLVVLDQDIIPKNNFLLNFAVSLKYTEKCLFLGFREDISIEDLQMKIQKADINPNFETDWRFSVSETRNFEYLNLNNIKDTPKYDYSIIKETNYLKEFGFGRNLGYWDLPCMVITHSLAFKKSEAIKSGGVPEVFYGWGMMDIAFGACMIANNNFIIPMMNCTSFHLQHPPLTQDKLNDFKNNISTYKSWANQKIDILKFPERNIVYESNTLIKKINVYL